MASTRREQARPKPLAKQNSSFIGSIKSFVSSPLNWLSGNEDTQGKRRRDDPIVVDDDLSHRSKRMRIDSPAEPTPAPVAPPLRRPSVVPRASSVVLPSTRATLSPRRVQRTMSIDPPRRDTDMDMLIDNPPSPRLPFRMRSSLTPQPQQAQQRFNTEPPPLNTLASNPVFIHQPTQPRETSTPPTTTLGSLVETVRAKRSPVKQKRSILTISEAQLNVSSTENTDAAAERALHQLDIFKTPLLPTRLRTSNMPASIVASTTPDMFKSRRSAHLVLMQDEKERPGRRVAGSSKTPVVNDTKPYAGEGGMKKLLARRRQEEEEEGDKDEQGKEKAQTTETKEQVEAESAQNLPPPPSTDWFAVASSDFLPSGSGSSLRVGRAKTSRNHIQRPPKNRFSAVYEDDPEDKDEDSAQSEEKKILEEAAKKVPVFNIPEGFTFAKDAPPVVPADLEKAKEPPIAALPFSFAKPSSAAATAPLPVPSISLPPPAPEPKTIASEATRTGVPNFFSNSPFLSTPPPSAPALSFNTTPTPTPPPVQDASNPLWDGEKKKSAEANKPSQSLFAGFGNSGTKSGDSTASVSIFGAASVPPPKPLEAKPVPENTLNKEQPNPTFSFGQSSDEKKEPPKVVFGTGIDTVAKPPSIFGEPSQAENVPRTSAPQSTPSPLPFTFGAPTSKPSQPAPAEVPSFFATPASAPAAVEAPKPLFGGGNGSSSLFGQTPNKEPAPTSVPFSFGSSSSATSAAEVKEQPTPTPAPAPAFSFGSSAATTESKPASLFSFGSSSGGLTTAPAAAADPKPSPLFAFGSTPAGTPSPQVQDKSTPAFSFGQPSTAIPASGTPSTPFSFGGASNTSADVSSKPFAFGQPNPVAATERPVTPPKNNENEFRMEESPTRDLQQTNGNKTTSTLNGAFSFGATSTGSSGGAGSLFGSNASPAVPSPTPFSFGSTSANPFAPKESKPEEPKGFGGFGPLSNAAPPINTSFSFGQPKDEAQRPATTGSFAFGTPVATTPTNAFSFGAPTASTNPFGSSSNAGSAPSSPSTFNQPSPFAFAAPAPVNSTFTFGSQPNSPATSNSGLPQSSGGFGGSGFGQAQQPSSPFSGPIALAPSTSGGGTPSLFTIGAAPNVPAGAPRQIKKLPNRRATGKR
ncbi:hypothetical protein D9613_002849 [Agrocybe pediades]|uniref:Uncharacterized protein n=1 Tax=Agrocybe pediades TaxID=84607 RepID=A0A8H4QR06_9AGAR|nr:hypothetical protein D9613_002849 [Agrocybe pediades]